MILLENYLKHLNLTDELIAALIKIARKFTAKPEQLLLVSPQICDRLFFIEEGEFLGNTKT